MEAFEDLLRCGMGGTASGVEPGAKVAIVCYVEASIHWILEEALP
jgi:hypothetical protein